MQDDEWADIEERAERRADAFVMLRLSIAASDSAAKELLRSERAMCFAVRRAQRARRHAARVGRLLMNAVKLVEMSK